MEENINNSILILSDPSEAVLFHGFNIILKPFAFILCDIDLGNGDSAFNNFQKYFSNVQRNNPSAFLIVTNKGKFITDKEMINELENNYMSLFHTYIKLLILNIDKMNIKCIITIRKKNPTINDHISNMLADFIFNYYNRMDGCMEWYEYTFLNENKKYKKCLCLDDIVFNKKIDHLTSLKPISYLNEIFNKHEILPNLKNVANNFMQGLEQTLHANRDILGTEFLFNHIPSDDDIFTIKKMKEILNSTISH